MGGPGVHERIGPAHGVGARPLARGRLGDTELEGEGAVPHAGREDLDGTAARLQIVCVRHLVLHHGKS